MTRRHAATTAAAAALLLLTALLGDACTHDPTPTDPIVHNPTPDPTPTTDPPPAPAWPDEPFRAQRPPTGPAASFKSPAYERFTLANGLRVTLVTRDDLPVVAMNLSFQTGSAWDPARKEGLAALTSRLWNQGTADLDKSAFEARQDELGASVWAYMGSERSGVQLRALKRNLQPTLDLAIDLLLRPGLRTDDLDRVRKELLADLLQQKGNTRGVADRLLQPLVFGTTHPYGRLETEKSIQAVTHADCKRLLSTLKPAGADLIVVGAITRAELEALLNPRLAPWTGKAPAPRPPPKAAGKRNVIVLVDVPNAPQSEILIAHEGPPRQASDYEANSMMTAILGGSFSSRINMNIREDKGWAYGARASFAYFERAGYFSASSSVRTDATGPAIVEILKEIRQMANANATPAELQREREGALLRLPSFYATQRAVLDTTVALTEYGLPLDWYDAWTQRLGAVDEAAVLKSAKDHLKPDKALVFIAGDAKTIRPQLEPLLNDKTLGIKAIVTMDADGRELKR